MKELDELDLPDNLFYAEDHEYVRQEGDAWTVGISDYAQNQLGDIVFVDLPQIGETVGKGEEFGTVESVKAVAELYMPVGGEIVGINESLDASPQFVNQSPYKEGWLIQVKPTDQSELESLMSRDTYLDMLKGLE